MSAPQGNRKQSNSLDSKLNLSSKESKNEELESIFDGVDIPENQKEKIEERLIEMSNYQAMTFSGPLPHPILLEGYNDIVENGAERIFKAFENQTNHRLECERKLVDSKIGSEKRGQTFGFVIAIIGLSLATLLAILNHPTVASIIGGASIVGLATVFVTGKVSRAKVDSETNEKN